MKRRGTMSTLPKELDSTQLLFLQSEAKEFGRYLNSFLLAGQKSFADHAFRARLLLAIRNSAQRPLLDGWPQEDREVQMYMRLAKEIFGNEEGCLIARAILAAVY